MTVGPVEPGRHYVIVDDVTVMGNTLAHHIQDSGGEVAGIVTACKCRPAWSI